jgi:hypothetical protein
VPEGIEAKNAAMLARPLGSLLLSATLGTSAAFAAPPGEPANPPPAPAALDGEDPEPPLIPPASDKLGGHLVVGGGASVAVQFGPLKSATNATTLGAGLNTMLDLGIGVGRTVTLGVFGEFARYPAERCPDCSATSFGVGPFARYHLVQGARFDPWMLVSVAYRTFSAEGPLIIGSTQLEPVRRDFRGVEWGHLAFGADFYVFQNFAFGPWLEITGGHVANEPLDIELELAGLEPRTTWTAYGCFSAGLRLVFDAPGK